MQTKKVSSYEELKKSICKNYLKGVCPFGKECKYRHPPKQRDAVAGPNYKKAGKETEVPVCKYFLQNKCKRGDECPFPHVKPKPEKSKRRSDWLTFCLYFPSGQCKNKDCRYLHVCEEDKDMFRATGKVDPYVLEQAMCKALLQDVVVNGKAQICKDYLQGHCKWMSCPLLHLTRQEFSQYILDALGEKFASVIGPPEDYHLLSGNAYNHSAKLHEPIRYKSFPEPPVHDRRDALPAFKEPLIRDSYIPGKENYAFDGSYGMGYGSKHRLYDRREEYDQQNFVSTDADRIVKGIYNLMREDGSLIRSVEKREIFDLRGKLNNLAEENARYRYEFSTLRPHEGERYKPPAQILPDQYDFKYQDVVRKLEKENAEMKRQLLMFREMEQESPYYMEKPDPLFFGSHSNQQEHRRGGSMRGQSHHLYDMRGGGEDRRWHVPSAYGGGHAPMAGRGGHPYNPLKQKVNNQLWHNMAYQYKKPQQMNQGAYPYSKGNNPKYQKPNQNVNRKTQQQNQKTQKSNPKVNQKKKPEESKNPNQAKSVKPKTVNKESSGKEDNEAKVGAEDDSSVEETHSDKDDDKEDRPQEIDARISEAGTVEDENESTATEHIVTGEDGKEDQVGNEVQEKSSEEENEDQEKNSEEENEDQEKSSDEGNEDQEKSSDEGNEDQEKSSDEGNEDQEKSSDKGNKDQEKNMEDGNQDQEKSSEDGNQGQVKNSEDGIQDQESKSAKLDIDKRVEMTKTETENEEETHGEDKKVNNKTDAKENKSSEKDCNQVAEVDQSE